MTKLQFPLTAACSPVVLLSQALLLLLKDWQTNSPSLIAVLWECFDHYTVSSGIYTVMVSLSDPRQLKIKSLSSVRHLMFVCCERFGHIMRGLMQCSGYDESTTKSLMKIKLGLGLFQLFDPVFIFLAFFVAWAVVGKGQERSYSVRTQEMWKQPDRIGELTGYVWYSSLAGLFLCNLTLHPSLRLLSYVLCFSFVLPGFFPANSSCFAFCLFQGLVPPTPVLCQGGCTKILIFKFFGTVNFHSYSLLMKGTLIRKDKNEVVQVGRTSFGILCSTMQLFDFAIHHQLLAH